MSPYVGYQETLVHLPCNESKCLALYQVLGKLGTFRMTVASSWNARVRMKGLPLTRWAISKVYPGLTKLRISGSTLHVHGNKGWSRGSEATPIGEDGYSSLEGRF